MALEAGERECMSVFERGGLGGGESGEGMEELSGSTVPSLFFLSPFSFFLLILGLLV